MAFTLPFQCTGAPSTGSARWRTGWQLTEPVLDAPIPWGFWGSMRKLRLGEISPHRTERRWPKAGEGLVETLPRSIRFW